MSSTPPPPSYSPTPPLVPHPFNLQRNKKKSLGLTKNSYLNKHFSHLLQFNAAKSPQCLTAFLTLWEYLLLHIVLYIYLDVFIVYLLMGEPFVSKFHFFKFLSMSDKPLLAWLDLLKSITATRDTSFSWENSVPSVQEKANVNKKGEILCANNKYEALATYQAP